MKKFIVIILIIIFTMILIYYSKDCSNYVFAVNGNSTSDLQLMARAINRGSKGRIL